MGFFVRRAAVIGAGTMGGGIAAHLANAGITVDLLDVVPPEVGAQGVKELLGEPQARDRIAREALARMCSARATGVFLPRVGERVRPGNIDDHFDRVGDADWVIEAIIEDLQAKRDLMGRIAEARRPTAIVSTNSSGLPLREIAAGLPVAFGRFFLGTHFFNPPRLMRLLEIIPGPYSDPQVLDFMVRLAESELGKGVVVCKDTPNFIANRIASLQVAHDVDYVVAHNYTVEEADAILGPPIGRPRTALFGLRDLVGLDVSVRVVRNLHSAIPEDPFRELLVRPRVQALWDAMVRREWLGRKACQGFYKEVTADGGRVFWVLDLDKLEYRPPRLPLFPALETARETKDLGERLRFLVTQRDRVGELAWASLKNTLAYAAHCLPEIAKDLCSVDRAMRWGYSWEKGPFEIWDELGVSETTARMQAEGQLVAGWVLKMLERGFPRFYMQEDGQTRHYDLGAGDYVPLPADRRALRLSRVKAKPGAVVCENAGASLVDLGDGVACLEFHTKANAMDDAIYGMMAVALEELDRNYGALVIGNDGRHFSAGANLQVLLERARGGRFDEIEEALRRSQDLRMSFRFSPRPVVVACFGMALGGGAETVMAASRVCAAAETSIGLVETGVGLLPGAGGCKELMRRVVSPPMRIPDVDPLPFVRHVFVTILQGKTSGSAEEARELGFLAESDRVVMNREHLLASAKQLALQMVEAGYRPPLRERNVYAIGRCGENVLGGEVSCSLEAGREAEHDAQIARKLAQVLCGGNHAPPQWLEEQHILDLEREAFLSLAGDPRTQARIEEFLRTGVRRRVQN